MGQEKHHHSYIFIRTVCSINKETNGKHNPIFLMSDVLCLCRKNRVEQRANIKICFKLRKTFSETYEVMLKQFKNCREDLNNDKRPGRSEESNHAKLVAKICEIIENIMLECWLNSSTDTERNVYSTALKLKAKNRSF